MPNETQDAVNWALQQTYYSEMMETDFPITKDTPSHLVDAVREYFNENSVAYQSFSYDDLVPYL